ncbi:hypothetical protein HUJ04_000093 [Dendroctonus ponderosae]|nr:hypothetical protein HUJ04_000093 [Dendroctonus ponderosae]
MSPAVATKRLSMDASEQQPDSGAIAPVEEAPASVGEAPVPVEEAPAADKPKSRLKRSFIDTQENSQVDDSGKIIKNY